MNNPKIIAHRGFCLEHPENSLPAFKQAINLPADGVECDVRKTKDGHIILMHDGQIERTTTGEGLTCQMTLSQIREFSLKKGTRVWDEQKVPTLDEFLELMSGNDLYMRIEVKEVGVESLLVEKIRKMRMQDRTTIISFYPMVIKAIKSIDPEIKTSLITERFEQIHLRDILPDIDSADLAYYPPSLHPEIYKLVKSKNLELDFWTIDTPELFRESLEFHPDFITTDRPDLLIHTGRK